MKRPARVPSQISEALHKRLSAYAIAASAAGVGALALAQPAEARIVYTPTHKVIRAGHPYELDLNHDGYDDFSIWVRTCSAATGCPWKILQIYGYRNSVAENGRSSNLGWLAAALKDGAKISEEKFFYNLGLLAGSQYHRDYGGNWFNVKNRYLGLVFYIDGEKHYGWARMNVRTHKHPFAVTGILTGYAYETIPNKPIIAGKTHDGNEAAPETGTLGALARGAK
jgi:hypothetical protein